MLLSKHTPVVSTADLQWTERRWRNHKSKDPIHLFAGKCFLWLHQAAFKRPGAAASAGSLVTPKLLVKTEVLLISNEITSVKNDIKSARIWVVSESCWDHRRAVKSFQVMQQPPAAEILQILKCNYSIKTRTSAVTWFSLELMYYLCY